MEPISPASATLGAAAAAVPPLIAFGVNLGLRPDVLVAGFAGALAAIVLLNSVPTEGDTWQHLLRTTWRRVGVSVASALVAGYLTPLLLLLISMPHALALGVAFVAGAGAERVLRAAIRRAEKKVTDVQQNGGQQP
jgi:hypothetical protein